MQKTTMKKLLSLLCAFALMMSTSVTAFAAEINEPALASLNDPKTGFTMQKVTITPVVVKPGSSTKVALNAYAKTTTLSSSSFYRSAYWDSYNVSGFNQYVYDNNYQMVGWNVSLTGKYTVSNENSVIPVDKLRYFEYAVGDGTPTKVDVQYSANRIVTYSWFAAIEGELTNYNSVTSQFNWTMTYVDGLSGKTGEVSGRLTAMMTYWPNYGVTT